MLLTGNAIAITLPALIGWRSASQYVLSGRFSIVGSTLQTLEQMAETLTKPSVLLNCVIVLMTVGPILLGAVLLYAFMVSASAATDFDNHMIASDKAMA